ncbi:MAG: hypothetical protein ACLT1A_00215 [Dysosmobacter sp.]
MMALLAGRAAGAAGKIAEAEKHQEVLCAYLLLRMALWSSAAGGIFPGSRSMNWGKPFFPDHPDTHFSSATRLGPQPPL